MSSVVAFFWLTCGLLTQCHGLNTGWIEYAFSAGIYCSESSNLCSRIAHFVLWIEPNNPLIDYFGSGYIAFQSNMNYNPKPACTTNLKNITEKSENDCTWQLSNSQVLFEQHYFNMTINSNNNNDSGDNDHKITNTNSSQITRVQAYNFMYESFFPLNQINIYNISCINAKLFISDPNDKNKNLQYLQLPSCYNVDTVELNVDPNKKTLSYYVHGNSTMECSVSLNQCRLVVHVVFKYAPKGDFIENYNYIGNGQLFINNNGTNETTLKGNMNVIWEKSINFVNDTWFHGSNWGFDYIGNMTTSILIDIDFVCWKIYVQSLQGDEIHYVPMDGGYGGYQYSKYVRCFQPQIYFWD